jgi:hypothetical protein
LQSDIPTRVFSEPQHSAPPATDIAREEGEFTHFVKGSSAPAPNANVSAGAPQRQEQPPPDPFPPAGSPGEFTRWLEGPQQASKPSKRAEIPGVSAQQSPGEYTRLISGQQYAPSPHAGPNLSPPPAPVGSPLQQPGRSGVPQAVAGDDFDRMIGSAPTPMQPPPTAPAAEAVEPSSRKERMIIIGVAACVVVLLVVAVVAVVFMRR